MKKMISPRLSVILLLIFSISANATVWYVHPDSLLNSIQVGIGSSSNGDTVLVAEGTYVENINFEGKNIVLGSLFLITDDTTYIYSTIIDGDSSGSVVTFENGENSNAFITGFTIQNGRANFGGGIYCGNNSSPSLSNVTISGNSANNKKGGLFGLEYLHGKGGGIYCCDNSNPSLSNVTISGNSAYFGGGIYCYNNSNPSFDSVNRCNIFLNFAGLGSDLYSINCDTIDVIVDNFTVWQPDDNFAYPIDNFTFDILNGKVVQFLHDLYVSPTGSDDNSGLSDGDPLLTVSYALIKILADSTNPHTILLSNGIYSPSETRERFPLSVRSYVSLQGESENSTILDGEGLSNVLHCYNDNYFSIENITIQNGMDRGIHCHNSNPSLTNVTVSKNNGLGIYFDSSSPNLTNVTISENSGFYGGGMHCYNSSPSLINVIISDNTSFKIPPVPSAGAGIYCVYSSLSLENVTISGNTADVGGGICCDNSSSSLTNVTISGNTGYGNGDGIYCKESSLILMNSILWPDEIYISSSSVTVTYSCVQGGWPGTGNIDEDPVFVSGPLSDYHLCPFTPSPCIDAGNPDAQYNDPEDPLIPGYAMWPALGTIRNDMGVYGGPGMEVWAGVEKEIYDEEVFTLSKAYPNPFMDKILIEYNLPRISDVNIAVYNVLGSRVRTLLNKRQNAGIYSVTWDGRDERGNKLTSGFYFLRLEAGKYKGTRKLLLIR